MHVFSSYYGLLCNVECNVCVTSWRLLNEAKCIKFT